MTSKLILTPEEPAAAEPPVNAAMQHAGHFTITALVVQDTRQFGFAKRDDGMEVYIPAGIINHYGLTAADIGAGFRALTRPAQVEGRHPQVVNPLYFDRDFPDVAAQPGEQPEETLAAFRAAVLPEVQKLVTRALELERVVAGARD